MQYWTIKIGVDDSWVADGFNCDNDRALSMLAHDLQFAHIGTELSAKVLKAPNPKVIEGLQNGSIEPA